MDEFREFVGRYPKIRDDVRSGKRTWQNIYEEWAIYGENDNQWQQYITGDNNNQNNINNNQNNFNNNQNRQQSQSLGDSVKNIVSYIQKINPDSLNRTLGTVQKVVQIAQSFGSRSNPTSGLMGSVYNDWWD